MKNAFTLTLACMLLVCFCNRIPAQTALKADSAFHTKAIDFPPLATVIDSAIKHNAMYKYRTLDIGVKESNLVSQRHYWLRNLGVQGDSRYGTIDAFSTNANGVNNNSSNTSSQQVNFAVGVYLKIPVYDVINRKTQIKQAKIELEEARALAVAQENEIRQIVIRQYQELLLRQKLLDIKSQNLGSAAVNMEMVEKEFRNGVIPVAEYVRLSDMTARIQADYEMASSDFLIAKKILEEIAGFSFKNPDVTKKQ